MPDEVPLDDLYPTNDAAFIPPESLDEMFAVGAPIFEFADLYKWERQDLTAEERRAFRLGWEAGIFEVLLKTGKGFCLIVEPENMVRMTARATMFRRTVTKTGPRGICVSEHQID